MKTYKQFSGEAEQLHEIGPGALLAPIKWLGGKAVGDLVWKGIKGAGKLGKNVAGAAINKTKENLKGSGNNKSPESTPSNEPGLPRAS